MKAIKLNADKVLINDDSLEKYLNDNNATLGNNANLDLSNLSDEGKKAFFPSDTYIDLDTSLTQYVAPANGYLVWRIAASAPSGYVIWGSVSDSIFPLANYAYSPLNECHAFTSYIPLRKGQTATATIANKTMESLKFFYAEGEV